MTNFGVMAAALSGIVFFVVGALFLRTSFLYFFAAFIEKWP